MNIKFSGLTPLAWPKGVIKAFTIRELKWCLCILINEDDDFFSQDGSPIKLNGVLFYYEELIFLICNRTNIDRNPISIFLVCKEDCEPRAFGHFIVRSMVSIGAESNIDKLIIFILEACSLLIINHIHEY